MWGSYVCTANARALGSTKADTIKSHAHPLVGGTNLLAAGGSGTPLASNPTGSNVYYSGSVGAFGAAETAPRHTAYAPRLHV
ncbi:conserved protein of unknown function [Burkholderia multivorans]